MKGDKIINKNKKMDGEFDFEIHGIKIKSKALFNEGPYGVFVGLIESDARADIPHYLVINTDHWVVEGSAARLFEARGVCQAYAKELAAQDELLDKGEAIVEPAGGTTSDPEEAFPGLSESSWKN